MIVADANLLAALLIHGPRLPVAERVLERDNDWVAPPLWRTEFASVLLKYVRAGQLQVPDAQAMFGRARTVVRRELPVDHAEVLRIAAASGASVYDSEYVHVSDSSGAPLVTADRRLAARFPGLAILPEDFAPN